MPPVSLELSTPRGAEMTPFSSPQFHTKTATPDTFRSPRPTKQSNIRVVTRIRPLLEDELARGRKACITPIIQPTVQPPAVLSPKSQGGEENTISPRNSLLKFRPSRTNSPSFQDDSILPKVNKTPSSLPPSSKSSAARTPSSSSRQPAMATSLLASSSNNNSNKQFDFDAVLGMESTQQQVYATAVGDKITNNLFRGINFTIMAYGQTASGKSHTMQGFSDDGPSSPQHHREGNSTMDDTENRSPDNPASFRLSEHDGIIPRAIHDLFQGMMDFRSSGKGNVAMDLTYVELYNEEMRDLLDDNGDDFRPLKMLDQGDSGGVVMEGLTTIPIQSAEQVHDLLNYATDRRCTSSTNANISSSRSHAICTLTVTVTPMGKSSKAENTQAKLTLVDLAGSERIKKTGVVGLQQQESITINQDLFALGQVVSALADKSRSTGKGKQTHVPFRNSKLTRLLRESLGGNCFTVLISCVSPADMDMDESINTLRYAEKARSISNSIKRNVHQTMLTPAQCTALTAENMRLKALVAKLKNRVAAEESRDTAGSLLDHEEAEECSPTSSNDTPRDIFRHDSKPMQEESRSSTPMEIFPQDSGSSDDMSQYSNFHHQERKAGVPIWKHFQDLAKITQHVTLPKESHREPTREIELKESKRVHPRGHTAGPERCLSYEMSLFPSGTDDLVEGVEEDANDQAIVNQSREIARLREENKSLQQGVDTLKSQRTELKNSIQGKQDVLLSLSKDIESRNASLEEKNQELLSLSNTVDSQKVELSTLEELREKSEIELSCDRARCDHYREESEQLKNDIEQMVKGINTLDLSSPQRSFAGILRSVDRRHQGFFAETEDDALELELEASFGALQKTKLHSPESCRVEAEDDLAATELKKVMNVLDQQLDHAKKQIVELEGELVKLKREHEVEIKCIKGSIAEEKQENDKRVASYELTAQTLRGEVQSLNAKVQEEKDLSCTLEERLNFMFQDYESMACLTQEKMSDLQDTLIRDKALKADFQYQIHVLRKASADLEGKLGAKGLALEKECNEKKDLQIQVTALEQKIKDLASLLRTEKKNANAKSLVIDTSAQKSKTLATLNEIATPESADSGNVSGTSSSQDKTESPQSAESKASQQPDYIRMKAAKMLQLADEAIGKLGNDGKSTTSNSCCSSAGTEFRPGQHQSKAFPSAPMQKSVVAKEDGKPAMPMRPSSQDETEPVQITNLALVKDENVCSCESKLVAENNTENAEYVDFYLPQISVECTCGKRSPKVAEAVENEDPCALASILRPWQVAFLADVGVVDAISLVYACNQRGGVLATQLRRWRRAKELPSVRTKSCGVALHIWSRTCKSVLRSVRSQKAQGLEPKRPDFLELSIAENNTVSSAVSSLGGGPFRS